MFLNVHITFTEQWLPCNCSHDFWSECSNVQNDSTLASFCFFLQPENIAAVSKMGMIKWYAISQMISFTMIKEKHIQKINTSLKHLNCNKIKLH